MRRSRVVGWLCLLVAGVALFSTPAAAQSLNRAAIDDLNEQLLYVALPLTLFVELTLIYAVYRFRNNDSPRPTIDDPALEITWTAATGAILVFVGVSAFFVMSNPYITPAAAGPTDTAAANPDVEIEVLAYQWGWEFHWRTRTWRSRCLPTSGAGSSTTRRPTSRHRSDSSSRSIRTSG